MSPFFGNYVCLWEGLMEAVKAKLAYMRPGEAILRNFPLSSHGQPQDKSLLEPSGY